ncbi:MAG: RNA polymerase sigma factor [Acidobacteriota bacterium]
MSTDDTTIARLRAGDEGAFRELLARHHANLVRFARTFVSSPATAEEVAQETWLAVLQGLEGFEGRSSLKSWIYSILANRARTRAVRDGRLVLFSEMSGDEDEPAVDPARFDAAGHWHLPPRPWDDLTPERLAASTQIRERLTAALEALPEAQRAVVMLRDIEGCSSEEACNVLGVSETNQRVLLHRARSRLRRALEPVMERGGRAP